MAKADYVGLNVSRAARDGLHRLAYRLSGETGRRVTLDAALLAACTVASDRLPDVLAALPGEDEAK